MLEIYIDIYSKHYTQLSAYVYLILTLIII